MADELKKFLDQEGLKVLWDQAKAKFIDEEKLAQELALYYTKEEVDELLNDFRAEVALEVGKKVDKDIDGEKGKARIFNEVDGGGAKFEAKDGTASFVGVNDDTNGGIGAQLYDIDVASNKGAKLDVTKNGIFYTKGDESAKAATLRDVEDNEIATKKDIKNLGPALHYIGMTDLADGEYIEDALQRVVDAYKAENPGYVLKAGAVAIINADKSLEYIYDGTKWDEFGAEGIYETKADAEAAYARLADAINAEEIRAKAAEAKKVDKELIGANGKALIFNEADGGGAKFENNNGVESFVGVHDGSNGIVAQIYADKLVEGKWQGAKLDVSNEGIYYTVGNESAAQRMVEGNKLATIKDVEAHDPEAMTEAEIKDICK